MPLVQLTLSTLGLAPTMASLARLPLASNGLHQNHGGSRMIEMRRIQLSFGDGLVAEEVSNLRESWMIHADAVLADEDIVAAVYEALAKRHPRCAHPAHHQARASGDPGRRRGDRSRD
jgi:hypothetical protein